MDPLSLTQATDAVLQEYAQTLVAKEQALEQLRDGKRDAFDRVLRVQTVILYKVQKYLFAAAIDNKDDALKELASKLKSPLESLETCVKQQEAANADLNSLLAEERSINQEIEQTVTALVLQKPPEIRANFSERVRRNVRQSGIMAAVCLLAACSMPIRYQNDIFQPVPTDSVSSAVHNNARLIGEGEYVIPDSIFSVLRPPQKKDRQVLAYYQVLDAFSTDARRVAALPIQLALHGLRLDSESTERYTNLLFGEGIIVYRESTLQLADFKSIVVHERIHREWDKLEGAENGALFLAALALTKKIVRDPVRYCTQTKLFKTVVNMGCLNGRDEAEKSVYEFYSWLSQGVFGDKLLKELQNDFPKAYVLYQRMLASANKDLPR